MTFFIPWTIKGEVMKNVHDQGLSSSKRDKKHTISIHAAFLSLLKSYSFVCGTSWWSL